MANWRGIAAPNDGAITNLGTTATTTHSLGAGDVLIGGQLEVDGNSWFDGVLTCFSNLQARALLQIGTSSSDPTFNNFGSALALGLNATDMSFVITNVTNDGKNHDHGSQTNNTVFIHSATDPDTANDEWLSMTHDVTDGVINWGSGDLSLAGGNVKLVSGGDMVLSGAAYFICGITDSDGTVEGSLWYDASEDKLKFKTAAGVETITSS